MILLDNTHDHLTVLKYTDSEPLTVRLMAECSPRPRN